MTDIATNLRRVRADMLGTNDEEHYWHCHEAADEIERLQKRNALLEDVAVAAEQHTQAIEEGFAAVVRPDIARMQLNRALDKLREVGDG